MGVAVDKAEKEGEKDITLQIANVGKQSSGGGGGGKASKEGGSEAGTFFNISNTGLNINEIMRDYEHKMSRRVYLPHNQALSSAKSWREMVCGCFGLLCRAPEARMTLYMAISRARQPKFLNVNRSLKAIHPMIFITFSKVRM
jgi:spore germination protein KC